MQEVRPDARTWPMTGALLSLALLGGCSPAPMASGERPIDPAAYEAAKLSGPAGAATRASLAGVIRGKGFMCGEATAAAPTSTAGLDRNLYDVRVTCQGQGRTAAYRVIIDPDLNTARVTRIID